MNKQISRRDFLRVSAGLAAGAVLSACGPTPPPEPTQAPAAAPTDTPVPKVEPVSLTVWHGETPPNRVEAFQKIIDDFAAANPDIQIVQETFNWPEAYAKVVAAVQAGNQPDMCFTIGSHMHAVMTTGAVQPLDDLFNEIDKEVHFFPKSVAPFRFEGKVYAIPLFGLTHLLVYRTDLLADVGFSNPPATWEEWSEAAKALTGDGKYALTLPASKHLYTDQCVTDFMVTNKADIFAPDGTLIFNSPATVEAYRFYGEMYQYSPPDAPTMTFAEANASFLTGQSAMTLIFGAIFARLPNESPDFADNVAAAPVPMPPNGQKGSVGEPNGCMVLTDDPAKKAAIARFLKYLTEPEMNAFMLANMQPGLYMPLSQGAAEAEALWDHPILNRYKQSIQTAMELTKDTVTWGFNHEKPHPQIAPIAGDNMLAQVAQKICIDGMGAEEAVAWGHERMEELIA